MSLINGLYDLRILPGRAQNTGTAFPGAFSHSPGVWKGSPPAGHIPVPARGAPEWHLRSRHPSKGRRRSQRAACRRDRAGRHDGTVIILLHPFFPKISGFSGQGICRHYFVLHGAFHDSGKYPADLFRRNLSVLRICTEGRTGACRKEAPEPEILRGMDMLCKETDIPTPLPGYIGRRITRAPGYTDAIIKGNAVIQKKRPGSRHCRRISSRPRPLRARSFSCCSFCIPPFHLPIVCISIFYLCPSVRPNWRSQPFGGTGFVLRRVPAPGISPASMPCATSNRDPQDLPGILPHVLPPDAAYPPLRPAEPRAGADRAPPVSYPDCGYGRDGVRGRPEKDCRFQIAYRTVRTPHAKFALNISPDPHREKLIKEPEILPDSRAHKFQRGALSISVLPYPDPAVKVPSADARDRGRIDLFEMDKSTMAIFIIFPMLLPLLSFPVNVR